MIKQDRYWTESANFRSVINGIDPLVVKLQTTKHGNLFDL